MDEETSRRPAWTTVELMDTAWPGAPMAFATILIPADWQATGGIAAQLQAAARHAPGPVSSGDDPYAAGGSGSPTPCQAMPLTCLGWSAGRTDGSQGIAILPSATWFVDVPPAGRDTPSMVEDVLLVLARQRHPDARAIAFTPVDAPAQPGGDAGAFPTRWESGRLVVAHRTAGRDMREEWTTVLMIGEAEALPDGGRRLLVTRNPPIVLHAPAAGFDALDRERIRASMTMAPDWWARLGKLAQAQESARQRHACEQAIHHPRPPGCDRMLPPG